MLVGEEINRQKLFDRIVKTAIEEKKNCDLVTFFPSKLHFISIIFLTESCKARILCYKNIHWRTYVLSDEQNPILISLTFETQNVFMEIVFTTMGF